MRLFLAIELSEDVKNELIKIQEELKPFLDAKFVELENLHLTLKFLGDVDEKVVGDIKEKLRKIRFGSFSANLHKIGIFPSEKLIRVLWIGVEPADKVCELYEEIEKILGNKPERFESHITLARIKNIHDKKEFLDKIKQVKVKPLEFEVKGFVLKNSILTPKGPIYKDVERFGLD